MTDRRKPENAELRRQWLTVQDYMREYSLSRSTLYKLAHYRMVTFKRITYPAHTKPMVRVENKPPLEHMPTS